MPRLRPEALTQPQPRALRARPAPEQQASPRSGPGRCTEGTGWRALLLGGHPRARDPAGGTCSLRRHPVRQDTAGRRVVKAAVPCAPCVPPVCSPAGRGSSRRPRCSRTRTLLVYIFPVQCSVSWLASFGERWGCGTPGPSRPRRLRRVCPASCLRGPRPGRTSPAGQGPQDHPVRCASAGRVVPRDVPAGRTLTWARNPAQNPGRLRGVLWN